METTEQRIQMILMEHFGVDKAKVIPSANFVDDLGADSLDTIEVVMAIEEEFGFEILDEEEEKIQTVRDLIDLVEARTA